MTQFLIDASSFQGTVNWWTVGLMCAGGWEKVTQGTTYVNPYWLAAQPVMAAQIPAGFTPGAYLFMEAGDGAAQADFFADHAGPLHGFGVAVDVEPSVGLRRLAHLHPEVQTADRRLTAATLARATSSPTQAQARACVARLRQLYPGKPIGGYPPFWFWGEQDTTFWDYLWASSYVAGTGRPQDLYRHVTPQQWAPYGGRSPALLQFTASATVPGVNGLVDCSAYQGADLAGLMTGAGVAPRGQEDDDMAPAWLPNARSVPLAIPNGVTRVRLTGLGADETVRLDWLPSAGADNPPTDSVTVGYTNAAAGVAVPGGIKAARLVRGDLPQGETDYSLIGITYTA